jgi:hypothetical protein
MIAGCGWIIAAAVRKDILGPQTRNRTFQKKSENITFQYIVLYASTRYEFSQSF